MFPTPPPALSSAKFVRGPSNSHRGKASASAGIAVIHGFTESIDAQDDETSLAIPVAEGSGAFRLARWYDLAVTVGSLKATVEGNIVFLDLPRLRLGILHGFGGWVRASLSENDNDGSRDWHLQYDLSAGLMVEAPTDVAGSGFASFKYTFGDDRHSESHGKEFVTDGPLAQTHYLTGSVGWLTTIGTVEIAPEIIVSHASYAGRVYPLDFGEDDGGPSSAEPKGEWLEDGYWLFLTGVTISAPF